MMVSLIQSSYRGMGSGLVADHLGSTPCQSDIGMPDMDGYDLIRRLRARIFSTTGDRLAAVAVTACQQPLACHVSRGVDCQHTGGRIP
jgi:DNA-binding NarL/FixJ family response regulator